MRTAILARHAQSETNVRDAINGDVDAAVPLTPAGEEQARELGRRLAGDEIDLCVVSALTRTLQTAELALAGRQVPIEVWPELNDPRYGQFEGGPLDVYREWAWAHGSVDVPPGDGESRHAIVTRYAAAFRRLLEGPEETVLAAIHSLPIAYALGAARGEEPPRRVPLVEHATPYRLTADELLAAVEALETWCAAPTW